MQFEVLIKSLSQVPPKIIFLAFQLFELEVIFLSSTENMPYCDEGESTSSVSTIPEEIKFTEWLILGANLPELNLESADSTSKWVGTSCMGAYYVLNTYYVLYFTYNTLHTYRAKQD